MIRSIVSLLLALLLVGCQAPAAPATPGANLPPLKVGVLPIVESLPLYVAETEGLFAKEKLSVEIVPFGSAVERDSALQAGQIDGQLNDLVATMLLSKADPRLKIVRQTFQGSAAKPMMYVLAAPQGKVKAAADLAGAEIGLSSNSVIEYTTEALAKDAGLDVAALRKVEVAKIPVRFEMLMQGQLQAATLPDPLASLALAQGARLVLDDSRTGYGQSILTFRQEAVANKAASLRAFLGAYEQATRAINAEPNKYRALLVDRAKVPEPIKDSYAMPPYPAAKVPTEAEFNAVSQWLVGKGLLPAPLAYADLVTSEFLPR
ncbi:MAG: ABC transporter substrate-binding protein [Chloroflexota bacterium]